MSTIFSDITLAIGSMPLVQLNFITNGLDADVLAKLGFQNPLGSVKERIGVSMIEATEKEGLIRRLLIDIWCYLEYGLTWMTTPGM